MEGEESKGLGGGGGEQRVRWRWRRGGEQYKVVSSYHVSLLSLQGSRLWPFVTSSKIIQTLY